MGGTRCWSGEGGGGRLGINGWYENDLGTKERRRFICGLNNSITYQKTHMTILGWVFFFLEV